MHRMNMINVENGMLKIDDDLVFHQGYLFDDFKKTKYYDGEDGVKIIYLKEIHIIDKEKYLINFFFREGIIYVVSLINVGKEFIMTNESERKLLHDKILAENGILSGEEHSWGKIISEFDSRSNISSINVYYRV